MAQYPNPVENREELNLRLGIKSSLYNLRSIVASLYSMYIATNKTSHINYTQEFTTSGIISLKMQDSIRKGIDDFFGESQDISSKIETTPLFKAQIEALQVGLELFFHLAKVSFCQSGLSERTGSNRYNKCLDFSTNLLQLDLLLSSYPESEVKEFLVSWIGEKTYKSELENKVLMMLSVFSEDTQCKIRTTKGTEVYFQREGIYQLLTKGETVVSEDAKELVGPYRILKSYISSGMHPFIQDKNKVFQSSSNSTALANYAAMVSTMLDLSPRRQMVIQEETKTPQDVNHLNEENHPLQQIFYGAPGTGKSHKIEQLTNGSKVFRTTFHPDSDYSTFVGAYKPIMREVPMTTVIGTKVVPVEDKEGNPLYESKIQYEFVPQAFAQAYVEAWKDLDTPVYLVIEEINRGNCAQIFGDIFQLLDRKKSGFSNYYIVPDEDLRQYIAKAFKDGIDERAFEIIKTGKNLCLPPNLYIWATMNTSDQSLFPIDSAFKRRWDWQYIPIENAELGWKINVNGNSYDWWEFLQAINKEVFILTLSEDKQLGYFFVQAKDNIIDAKVLVNKVFFYLWNDVFKDFDMDNSKVFRQAEGQNSICFKDFYASVGEIKEDIAEQILINLGLEKEA